MLQVEPHCSGAAVSICQHLTSKPQSLVRSIVTTGAGLLTSLIGALGRAGRWEDALAWFEARGHGDKHEKPGMDLDAVIRIAAVIDDDEGLDTGLSQYCFFLQG